MFGATPEGSAARVVGIAGTCGVICWAVVEPVPATGRWRVMLFDQDTETELMKPAAGPHFTQSYDIVHASSQLEHFV